MTPAEEKLRAFYYSRYFNLAVFGLIAVMTLLAYSNTFNSSFHFDDGPAISDNQTIKQVTSENIFRILSEARPVVYLSIMLNYQLSALNVAGWHIFNIGFHIGTSILVYLFLLQALAASSLKARYADRSKWMALFGGLLFAVHPVQTETVTYIISRSEILASFFYLGALLLFGNGVRTGSAAYYVAAFASAVLSMGSKEWAVTLPAAVFLYDYLVLSEGNIKKVLPRWWVYILLMLPWWIILRTLNIFSSGGGTVGFGMNASSSAASGPGARKAVTAWTYFLTSCNVIWTYIRLLFLPINQNIDYDYPVAQTLLEFPTVASFAGHLAIIGGAFWLFWKKRWALVPFGVAWFYMTLSPVQSIVPVSDVIFEHRVYLSSVGFFLVVVVLYEQFVARLEGRENAIPADAADAGSAPEARPVAPGAQPAQRKKMSRKAARRAKKAER